MSRKYCPIDQVQINNKYHIIHRIQLELAYYLNNHAYDFDFIINENVFIEIFRLLLNFDIETIKIEIGKIIYKNNHLKYKYCPLTGEKGLLTKIKKIINCSTTSNVEDSNDEIIHDIYEDATEYLPVFKKQNGVHYGYLAIKKISNDKGHKIHLLIKKYFEIYLIKSEKRAIPIDGLSLNKLEWLIPFKNIENIFTSSKTRYERNFALNEIIKLASNDVLKISSKIIIFNKKYAEIIKYYNGFISYEDAKNLNIFNNKTVENLLLINIISVLVSNPDLTAQHIGFDANHQIVMCDAYPALLLDEKAQGLIEINKIKNLQLKLDNLFSILKNGKCFVKNNGVEIEYNNLEIFINEYFIAMHIGNYLSETQILKEINIVLNSFEKNFNKIKNYADFIGKIIVIEDNKDFTYKGELYSYTDRMFHLFEKLKKIMKNFKHSTV